MMGAAPVPVPPPMRGDDTMSLRRCLLDAGDVLERGLAALFGSAPAPETLGQHCRFLFSKVRCWSSTLRVGVDSNELDPFQSNAYGVHRFRPSRRNQSLDTRCTLGSSANSIENSWVLSRDTALRGCLEPTEGLFPLLVIDMKSSSYFDSLSACWNALNAGSQHCQNFALSSARAACSTSAGCRRGPFRLHDHPA